MRLRGKGVSTFIKCPFPALFFTPSVSRKKRENQRKKRNFGVFDIYIYVLLFKIYVNEKIYKNIDNII